MIPRSRHIIYFIIILYIQLVERMPATAGRVRMPHNNRVSTERALHTSSIWKQTIGHDPYANKEADAERDAVRAKTAEQAKGLLELARHQNLANNMSMVGGTKVAGGDDFARKMFLGLKPKKLRKDPEGSSGGDVVAMEGKKVNAQDLLETSSSEEEFIEVEVEEDGTDSSSSKLEDESKSHKKSRSSFSSKKKRKRSSKKKKRRYDSSSSDEESKRHGKKSRKKRRSKEKKKEKRRRRSESTSSSD